MSLNFVVQKVESYQGIPDGYYLAQVDHIEYVKGNYGNHHLVKWTILGPSEFEGRTHQERYNVEHENELVRKIAISNFSKFCVEIGGLKEGDVPTEENFLYKQANILIRSRTGKNDDKVYSNIVKMELVGNNKPVMNSSPEKPYDAEKTAAILALAGIQMPEMPAASSAPLNDEVPF